MQDTYKKGWVYKNVINYAQNPTLRIYYVVVVQAERLNTRLWKQLVADLRLFRSSSGNSNANLLSH